MPSSGSAKPAEKTQPTAAKTAVEKVNAALTQAEFNKELMNLYLLIKSPLPMLDEKIAKQLGNKLDGYAKMAEEGKSNEEKIRGLFALTMLGDMRAVELDKKWMKTWNPGPISWGKMFSTGFSDQEQLNMTTLSSTGAGFTPDGIIEANVNNLLTGAVTMIYNMRELGKNQS